MKKAGWTAFKVKYWGVRTPRERSIIKISAAVLMPVLGYWLLWQPANTAVQKLRISVPQMSIQADRLKSQAAEVELLRHSPKPAFMDAVALKSTIEESALRNNLREAITTITLQEPGSVRISFVSVSFEQWMNWLRSLQIEQKIRADSVGVVALPQAGMVKISATLTNGGAR